MADCRYLSSYIFNCISNWVKRSLPSAAKHQTYAQFLSDLQAFHGKLYQASQVEAATVVSEEDELIELSESDLII
jgi:hypothetical protein